MVAEKNLQRRGEAADRECNTMLAERARRHTRAAVGCSRAPLRRCSDGPEAVRASRAASARPRRVYAATCGDFVGEFDANDDCNEKTHGERSVTAVRASYADLEFPEADAHGRIETLSFHSDPEQLRFTRRCGRKVTETVTKYRLKDSPTNGLKTEPASGRPIKACAFFGSVRSAATATKCSYGGHGVTGSPDDHWRQGNRNRATPSRAKLPRYSQPSCSVTPAIGEYVSAPSS